MIFTRRTKRVLLGFIALGLVVFFVILASFRFAEAAREKRRYEMEKVELRVPEPNIVAAEVRDLERVRRFTADLRPWIDAEVPAEVAGRVTEVFVEGGSVVEPGALLVKLDETLARLAVDQAQARYEESLRLRAEAERLFKTRAISETAYQAQMSAVRLDKAVLAEAGERLARHTIRAPFPGIVDKRMVDVGEAVNANQPVARVVDLEKLRVEFYVTAADLSSFPVNQPVRLLLDSHPHEVLNPTVDFVSPAADQRTRLFRVEAVMDNEKKLPGGLQGVVQSVTVPFRGLPSLPAAAVQFSGRQSLVWKVQPDGPELVEIRIGPELDGFYPVLEGLNAGDRVLIR
jgi:membrane fusion protein (multidrug efflux system)